MFHFSLQAVLHFRQSQEHQQELRLRAANQQVGRVRHAIEQLDQYLIAISDQQSQQLPAGATAAELQFHHVCETALRQRRLELALELSRLQHLRDQQQKIFEHARRERETLESLRNNQRQEYERRSRRREQRQLDDLYLARRVNPQNR
jgi:flagellar export protein FliJ